MNTQSRGLFLLTVSSALLSVTATPDFCDAPYFVHSLCKGTAIFRRVKYQGYALTAASLSVEAFRIFTKMGIPQKLTGRFLALV